MQLPSELPCHSGSRNRKRSLVQLSRLRGMRRWPIAERENDRAAAHGELLLKL
jgi:hypothetical protein